MTIKHTIIALVLLACVVGAYFILGALLPPSTGKHLDLYGMGRVADDVVGIDVDTGTAQVSVVFKGGKYWIRDRASNEYTMPAKQKQIHTFFSGLDMQSEVSQAPVSRSIVANCPLLLHWPALP